VVRIRARADGSYLDAMALLRAAQPLNHVNEKLAVGAKPTSIDHLLHRSAETGKNQIVRN